MEDLVRRMMARPEAAPFLHPVRGVPGYDEVVRTPMDLHTVLRRCDTYPDMDAFRADVRLIFANCRAFNAAGTIYVRHADALESFFEDQMRDPLEAKRARVRSLEREVLKLKRRARLHRLKRRLENLRRRSVLKKVAHIVLGHDAKEFEVDLVRLPDATLRDLEKVAM